MFRLYSPPVLQIPSFGFSHFIFSLSEYIWKAPHPAWPACISTSHSQQPARLYSAIAYSLHLLCCLRMPMGGVTDICFEPGPTAL